MWKLTIIGAGRLGKSIHTMLSIPHNIVGKEETIPVSDIYYLTVPDRSISQFANRLPKESSVIHASGSHPYTILRPHKHAAVLHPLMTFPGPEIAIPPAPIFASISGDTQACIHAQWLADKLGFQTFEYNGNRAKYHCSAVMAGNFAALLLDMAAQVMSDQSEISRAEARTILLPLMLESAKNCELAGTKSITGPITRNDTETMIKHRKELLSFSKHFTRSYDALATSLMHIHTQND